MTWVFSFCIFFRGLFSAQNWNCLKICLYNPAWPAEALKWSLQKSLFLMLGFISGWWKKETPKSDIKWSLLTWYILISPTFQQRQTKKKTSLQPDVYCHRVVTFGNYVWMKIDETLFFSFIMFFIINNNDTNPLMSCLIHKFKKHPCQLWDVWLCFIWFCLSKINCTKIQAAAKIITKSTYVKIEIFFLYLNCRSSIKPNT